MDVTLPPDLESFVDYMVAKGEYASPEEVLRAGVARMRGSDEDVEAERERLRALVQKGVDAADAGRLRDGDEVMRDLRARYEDKAVLEADEAA